MPSGFQQDQNQLTPSYYRVVIICNNDNAYWFAVGDGNGTNEGRISPFSADSLDEFPTTLAYSQALSRGNLRFQSMIEAVENLADCQILDVEVNNALTGDAQSDNSQVAFTIKFDRDEGVFPAYCAIRAAEGAGTNGSTDPIDGIVYPQFWSYSGQQYSINNTADSLRDIIWKALADGRTRSVRVFHPDEGTDPLVGAGFQEVITAAKPFDNDQNAFDDITVQEIDGTPTTLVSTD